MILWTIQTPEVYDLIQKQGYFFCDPTKSICINEMNFQKSYDWLVNKMKEKIGNPPKENIKYPIWAWHTYDWKRKKPDLRTSGFGKKGQQLICMEIEIPDENVVLSDFDSWHYVLGGWYHTYSTCDEEFEDSIKYLENLSKEERQKVIENSWNNIFNISKIDSEWIIQGKYIQATFWKLEKSQIRKIQYFTSR